MKLFLKRLYIFTSILIILMIIIEYGISKNISQSVGSKYHEIYYPQQNYNTIIIGSSHGSMGIDPERLEGNGAIIYNFSLLGGGPIFFSEWSDKLLHESTIRPSMVLYCVDWFMFTNKQLKRRLENDSSCLSLHDFLKEITLNISNEDILYNLIHNRYNFIKYRNSLKFAIIREPAAKYDNLFKKGYAPISEPYKKKEGRILTESSPYAFDCFNKLLDYYKNNNIKIIFINTPELIHDRSNQEYEKGISIVEQIAEERGITFLNYNKSHISSINYNTNLFFDWEHLNDKGGAVFSERLKKDLHTLHPDLF